jgi:hypothetical protein
MSDYYEVLGVPRDASQELLLAAYKALVKAFHPDVFHSDQDYAESRLKAVNAAYEALGDPTKRRQYDDKMRTRSGSSKSENPERWARVCEFFPNVATLDGELSTISEELSLSFRQTLLESKAFGDADRIKDKLINEFAKLRFGKNSKLQEVGLAALRMGNREFALALNQACSLVGEDNSIAILKRLAIEYPRDAVLIYKTYGLDEFLPPKEPQFSPSLYRIGNDVCFRIVPDGSVVVFSENGRKLEPYRYFENVDALLEFHGEQRSSVQRL